MKNPCENCLVLPMCKRKNKIIVFHECEKVVCYIGSRVYRIPESQRSNKYQRINVPCLGHVYYIYEPKIKSYIEKILKKGK